MQNLQPQHGDVFSACRVKMFRAHDHLIDLQPTELKPFPSFHQVLYHSSDANVSVLRNIIVDLLIEMVVFNLSDPVLVFSCLLF